MGAQRERQGPALHLGEHNANELLARGAHLQQLWAAFTGSCARPVRLDRVSLARWRHLEAQLGRRVPRRLDAERDVPVAQHGEAVTHVVLCRLRGLRLAVPLHLRHRAHRRHVVDESQARAVHRLALRVLYGDVEEVVAGSRRIRIELNLHEKVTRMERI